MRRDRRTRIQQTATNFLLGLASRVGPSSRADDIPREIQRQQWSVFNVPLMWLAAAGDEGCPMLEWIVHIAEQCPRINICWRPRSKGHVGKAELTRRFDIFGEGQWTELHRKASQDVFIPRQHHTQLDQNIFLSLKSAPRGSSAGPGGWTYEHLKVLLDNTDTFHLLLSACNSLAPDVVLQFAILIAIVVCGTGEQAHDGSRAVIKQISLRSCDSQVCITNLLDATSYCQRCAAHKKCSHTCLGFVQPVTP